jgi:hypothetical protein
MVASCASSAGSTPVAYMEILSFQSTTLTDQEFLRGKKEGRSVTIAVDRHQQAKPLLHNGLAVSRAYDEGSSSDYSP